MALRLTDVHCSGCGKKLCEEIRLDNGGVVRFTCPRCSKAEKFEDKPGAPARKTE